MRHLICCLGLCLLLVCPSPSGAATPIVKDGKLFVEHQGKHTLLPENLAPSQHVDGAKLRFTGIGPDDAAEYGIEAGLYLFDEKGAVAGFLPMETAEICGGVRLSPDKRVLAVDLGAYLIRTWAFFTYPGLKPLGDVAYYETEGKPALIWAGAKGVLVSSMNADEPIRECGYDPCGPVSIDFYTFADRKTTRLMAGTGLCDYTLTGLDKDGRTVTAEELCLPTLQDWATYPENAPTKSVRAVLP